MTGIEGSLAVPVVKAAAGPASNALLKWGKEKYDRFVATYTNAFASHIDSSVEKCALVRNILYRNQFARTDEKYVSVSFQDSRRKNVSDQSLVQALLSKRYIILKGRGGAGKTMFTKWAVLRIAERIAEHQQIPIYVELRDLDLTKSYSTFEERLFQHITSVRTKTNMNQFVEGLKNGLFVFILDAADEVHKTARTTVCKQIEQFRSHFPECAMLMTTRDFSEVNGMTGFEYFSTTPLEKKQALEILDKLDYDDEVRDALKKEVKADKVGRHAYFLENPLLVTIMLLTYDQNKEIPTKRSSFYKRAFEALYERHDASKGIYKRDHHAGLPMDEFERIFSTFCFGTYVNGLYDFSDGDLVSLMNEACSENGFDDDPESVAKDAHESTCLLIKEGHDFTFVHRSFQEYFTSVYIRDYRGEDIGDIIELALTKSQGENVVEFLYEMDRRSLERNYVFPRLDEILKKLDRKISTSTSLRSLVFAAHFFKTLKIADKRKSFAGLEFANSADANFLLSISAIYPEVNLIEAIADFQSMPIAYEYLPYPVIKKSRATKIAYEDGWNQDIISLKFTPSAVDWFSQSPFVAKCDKCLDDLQLLRQRLQKEYSEKPNPALSRFAKFAR